MFDRDHVALLMNYSHWANARLFSALHALPPLAVHDKLLAPLAHAHRVDLIWQANLNGKPHGFTSRSPDTVAPLGKLEQAQIESDAWFRDYTGSLQTPAFNEMVHFEFVGGGRGAMTRGEILLHVANHKTYHRGYVAQMLYELGSKPPVMDLTVFLREFRMPQ